MNEKDISTLLETDWERLDRMTDDDIDYSDIPPLGDTFFTQARVYIPPIQRANSVELDDDIMAWFRQRDKQYPSLINIILRKFIEIQQEFA